ncbi:hypothetical protein [Coleofasciculus sp. G2-EDA-02]|uniref:hypothetical protein n=1 Tax=Coleofasciculus sp. G2-EDA-02 TaxID=3069529 RepID=UPI003302B143
MVGKLLAPISGAFRKCNPLYLIPKRYHHWVFAFFVGLAIATVPVAARADGFDDAIAKIDSMANTLATLTTLFTEVVVTPMGFTAASRTFQRVVLGNL